MRVMVFDSGVGGVGVAQSLRQALPGARLTYLMDDAGFPYGGRTDADLAARVLEVVGAGLARVRPDIVVVACNTASTLALSALRQVFPHPFVGCVPPVRWAARLSTSRIIGVLATPATVRGGYLQELRASHAADCRMLVHGSAILAGLAEDRFAGRPVDVQAVHREAAGLAGQPGGAGMDAVALGCTHYALLLPELRAALPDHVAWLDPAPAVAQQVARVAQLLGPAAAMQSGTGGAPDGMDGVVLHTGAACTLAPGWKQAGFTAAVRLCPASQAA